MDPRLPPTTVPRHYEVELAPDLEAATFSGRCSVDIDIVEATDAIICNAAELEITASAIERDGRRAPLTASVDETSQRFTLTAQAPSTRTTGDFEPGPARLHLEFNGILNDKLRGFYRSKYRDESGNEHVIATTQFQSTDARRAFPCWDEPALKATFSCALVIDDGLLAVSNTSEVQRQVLGDGRVRVQFATTMVMSTYLVAFIVGELEATEPVDCDGVGVRVIHRPGRSAQTPFALDVATHALRWFSDYYELPYPSDKLDLVAVPDFAFGAMENLGCVTFREVLLLIDPDTASQPEMQLVADVVNHELAHMWFGDLVTMQWWEGIWLNEAFATFMEVACSDAYRPDWQVWSTFCRSRSSALATDALSSTRAVEYPVITPEDAEDMFDVITYEKGAALVRMLEQYLGPDAFRQGVRIYLKRHAHANAVADDLWNALAEASGFDVRNIMDAWIHSGGYPQVAATPTPHGLRISQRHFTLDPQAVTQQRWRVPLRIRWPQDTDSPDSPESPGSPEPPDSAATNEPLNSRDQDTETKLLLETPSVILTNAQSMPITLDGAATGFFRTRLTGSALSSLTAADIALHSPQERHGLVDDAWAFTLAGEIRASEFFGFVLGGFEAERDLIVWQAIAAALSHLRRLVSAEAETRFGLLVTAASDSAAFELGLDPRSSKEDDRTKQLRATLLALRGATAADPSTISACRQRLDHPDATLAAAALGVVAIHGDAEDFKVVNERYQTATDPQTKQRHLGALADFGATELVLSVLARTLDGGIRTQDGPYLLRRALANHQAGATAWDFIVEHWEKINATFPSNSVARMLEGIVCLDTPSQAAEVHEFLADNPVPQGTKQVAQHLERLDINTALRKRDADDLKAAVLARQHQTKEVKTG